MLGAAWDTFEAIRLTADAYSGRRTDQFVTWMAVIPPACEGRDAIGFAPSTPPDTALDIDLDGLSQLTEDQALRELARLASSCVARLRELAPVTLKDRAAIARAIEAAEEISGLLTEDG